VKVNGNDPIFVPAVSGDGDLAATESNIPIRLEIASRIMAGNFGWYVERVKKLLSTVTYGDIAADVLIVTDALIKAHNETCGGE